jgi:hemerythrin-like domain-containing protein
MAVKREIDPIARFMLDHDRALVQLASLNRASAAIAAEGFTEENFRKVEGAMSFIREEVSVHNASEEEALFPVLERYVEGPTRLMRKDHRTLKKEFLRLQKAVSRISQHRENSKAAVELAEISRTVVQAFVNHIHKENYILFPLVQKFLTKDALREVARRMV